MYQDIQIPSPLQEIKISNGKTIYIKREDLIHPLLSGNKYRKLKFNLEDAIANNYEKIISFGGAFSNHIHALAFSCREVNIPLLLFIRGEEMSNPTLDFVRACGASIKFINRQEYRLKDTPEYLHELAKVYPNSLIIPEGGTNRAALKGVGEMIQEIDRQIGGNIFEICVSYGSGGTSLGILNKIKKQDQLHVFPSLKIPDLASKIINAAKSWDITQSNFTLHSQYHFGGYAKWTEVLIEYINRFKKDHGIQLDPIYTGKLLYGVQDLLSQGYFDNAKKLVVVHTGGLQGIAGFNQRFGNLIK